jgi:hypothetical protein
MKTFFFVSFIASSFTLLSACNNGPGSAPTANADSTSHPGAPAATNTGSMTPTPVTPIVTAYLDMKNAFSNDDDRAAADAGKQMVKAFNSFDTTSIKSEQRKTYLDIEDDAREHAEHIGKNAGNIKHQREHFDMLSGDIYQLVKTFSAGRTLYYDHCPMYNDNKGADWISEIKDIKNPYLGKSMPTCGTMKEEIK